MTKLYHVNNQLKNCIHFWHVSTSSFQLEKDGFAFSSLLLPYWEAPNTDKNLNKTLLRCAQKLPILLDHNIQSLVFLPLASCIMKEKYDPTTKVGSNMVGIVGGGGERVLAAWNPTDLFLSLFLRGTSSLLLLFCSCGLFVFRPFFGLPFLSPLLWFLPSIFFLGFLFIFFVQRCQHIFVKRTLISQDRVVFAAERVLNKWVLTVKEQKTANVLTHSFDERL